MNDVLDRLRARLDLLADQTNPALGPESERQALSEAIQEIERLREEFADAVSFPICYVDAVPDE